MLTRTLGLLGLGALTALIVVPCGSTCPTRCNTLLANADGTIDIVFGCMTAGGTPR